MKSPHVPTSTEIENFVETYQTRHVSNAAIRLGITQPSLTQSLQKLEEKLDSKLFHRTKQGVVPTEEGTLFYAKARILLDAWKDVGEQVSQSRTALKGKFKVGCHQSVGAYILPQFFKNLNASAPQIQIELIHDFSRKITEKVVSYEVELGYVVNPVKHLDLVLKKMGEDEVSFYKNKNVAQTPKKLFADANLLHIEELLGKTFHKEFKGWTLVQTSSLELVRTLALSGEGVGVLPGRVAHVSTELGDGQLALYNKTLPRFKDEIFLAYRKEVLSSDAGKELLRAASFTL